MWHPSRDYRDQRLSAEHARRALESSALVPSPEALLRFVDRLGPYVLGYTAARDKVRSYVEAEHRRTGDDPLDHPPHRPRRSGRQPARPISS